MFLAGLHSPAARSGAAAGIKHGLVQLTEKMPLSVLIYRVRCRGPQQGTRTCPPLPALPVPALRAPRLVSGTARPRPAASRDSESQRCRESPRSRRGLGKRQEQRSVPRLPEKPLSCLRSPSPAARSALSPLLAAAQGTEVAPSTSPEELWQHSIPQVLPLAAAPRLGVPLPPGTRRCQRVRETSLRGRGFGAVDL